MFERFYDSMQNMRAVLQVMEMEVGILTAAAERLDARPDCPGNGCRSLLSLLETALREYQGWLASFKSQRESRLFRADKHATQLAGLASGSLRPISRMLALASMMVEALPPGALVLERDCNPALHARVMGEVKTIAREHFYGANLGFYYPAPVQSVLQTISTFMAAYSVGFSKHESALARGASSMLSSSRFMFSSSSRARQLVDITQVENIEFTKAFWNLLEAGPARHLGKVVAPMLRINRVLHLPVSADELEQRDQLQRRLERMADGGDAERVPGERGSDEDQDEDETVTIDLDEDEPRDRDNSNNSDNNDNSDSDDAGSSAGPALHSGRDDTGDDELEDDADMGEERMCISGTLVLDGVSSSAGEDGDQAPAAAAATGSAVGGALQSMGATLYRHMARAAAMPMALLNGTQAAPASSPAEAAAGEDESSGDEASIQTGAMQSDEWVLLNSNDLGCVKARLLSYKLHRGQVLNSKTDRGSVKGMEMVGGGFLFFWFLACRQKECSLLRGCFLIGARTHCALSRRRLCGAVVASTRGWRFQSGCGMQDALRPPSPLLPDHDPPMLLLPDVSAPVG